jgi:PHS family inorganic phosphate transporter-like MFS transporter
MLVIGFAYHKLGAMPAAFAFPHCLTNFFQKFGPNTTTFTIPGGVVIV